MVLGNLVILNNKGNRNTPSSTFRNALEEVYIKGNSESAYAAYRIITGARTGIVARCETLDKGGKNKMNERVNMSLETYNKLFLENATLKHELEI